VHALLVRAERKTWLPTPSVGGVRTRAAMGKGTHPAANHAFALVRLHAWLFICFFRGGALLPKRLLAWGWSRKMQYFRAAPNLPPPCFSLSPTPKSRRGHLTAELRVGYLLRQRGAEVAGRLQHTLPRTQIMHTPTSAPALRVSMRQAHSLTPATGALTQDRRSGADRLRLVRPTSLVRSQGCCEQKKEAQDKGDLRPQVSWGWRWEGGVAVTHLEHLPCRGSLLRVHDQDAPDEVCTRGQASA
jgi:hypothetical protein